MPKVQAQGKTIECVRGANLRQILLQNGLDLYNSGAKVINCRLIGNCGTCAVLVEGLSQPNWRNKARRSLPPPFSYNRPTFSLAKQTFGRCEGYKI